MKPAPPNLSPACIAALGYYHHEARKPYEWGENTRPLGGLTLAKFRTARDELARKGLIVKTVQGRWVLAPQPGDPLHGLTDPDLERAA